MIAETIWRGVGTLTTSDWVEIQKSGYWFYLHESPKVHFDFRIIPQCWQMEVWMGLSRNISVEHGDCPICLSIPLATSHHNFPNWSGSIDPNLPKKPGKPATQLHC